MRQPAFQHVVLILVVMAVLGLFANNFRDRIPPPVNSNLKLANGEFLSRATFQPVDWRLLSSDSIAEARRGGKPILLLVGVASSSLVAQLDATFFSDREVAGFLNLNYECIRVDGLEEPRWLNAFHPFTRLKGEFSPGFQLWILDPTGRVITSIFRTHGDQQFNRDSLLDSLVSARHSYDDIAAGKSIALGNRTQEADVTLLANQSGLDSAPFEAYTTTLSRSVDLDDGGFPRNGMQQLMPGCYVFLQATGQEDLLASALTPLIISPLCDPIDGGFFRLSTKSDMSEVEFNKNIVLNAEMLTLLARWQAIDPTPLRTFALEHTLALVQTNMQVKGKPAAFQLEANPLGRRSKRYSFSVAKLRSVLSPRDRTFAANYLGLDVIQSPQMSPYLSRTDSVQIPEFSHVIRELRASVTTPRHLTGVGYCEVNGTVAAALLESARLSGDPQDVRFAMESSAKLDQFYAQHGLLRQAKQLTPAYLGDYLAFADAKLQAFLLGGDTKDFDAGLNQLQYAEQHFSGDREGEYKLSLLNSPIPNTDLPELSDAFHESCTARIARLMSAYGRLLGNTHEGRRLINKAQKTIDLFSQIAVAGGPETGYFFAAAASSNDPMFALSVGENRVQLANQLARLRPVRLCAPAEGQVRPDMQDRAPGIYLVDDEVRGPYTVSQAASRLDGKFKLKRTRLPVPH